VRPAVAVFLFLTAIFASTSAHGQPLRLTEQQSAAIDAVFAEENITARSPGCGLALMHGGSILHFQGYGLADVEKGVAWTPQTGFHTGSMYKQFYAAAVVMLVQQGKLSLDDDVRKYVPELPDYGARITVRNVLTHTHGLRERFSLEDLTPPQRGAGDSAFLRLLARQNAPNDPPGVKLRYGNTGPFLAGLIIDRVTGTSRAEFIARNILEPFGMKSTALGQDSRVLPARAPGYVHKGDGAFESRPGGTIRTTLEDLARWDQRFEDGAEAWHSVVQVLTAPARVRDGTPVDMGMGLRLRPYRGLPRVWAPGGATGFRAVFMRFPDSRLTIALGCNRDDVEPVRMAEAIADVVLADDIRRSGVQASPRPVGLSRRHARQLAGTYVSDSHTVRVVERSGRLFLISDQGEFEMTPVGSYRFIFTNRPVILRDAAVDAQFRIEKRGVQRLELRTVWDPADFVRVPPIDVRSIRADEYVGRFVSDELESELEVVRGEGGLVLKAPRGEFPLKPISADVFVANPPPVNVERFAAGPIVLRFQRAGAVIHSVSVSRTGLPGIAFSRAVARPTAP
jgi:CubicO group peptidase (beta-lactamase class C family)